MAESISITICGDGGCGKSSITLRLVRSQWNHEYDPTIEDSYSVTRTVDGLPYFLSLTDTAGQEEYRGLWAASNLNSDAFLLVYDITNEPTLETLDHFMEMIDMETENREENSTRLLKQFYHDYPEHGLDDQPMIGMPPPVKIVAGNKCDLKEARVVSSRRGLEFARSRGCGFMETSAWEMVNIEETFALIVRRVVEARKLHQRQQMAQLQALREADQLSSTRFFSTAYRRRATQPVAHSQTAPLTTEEGQNPTGRSITSDVRPQRRSLWLSVQKAWNRRTTAQLRRSKSLQPVLKQWEGQSRPGTLSTRSSKKADPDAYESTYSNTNDSRHGHYRDSTHSGRFKPAERISLPWWKILCSSGRC
ncbi:hypothetical protein MaudCBS49596_006422 [Microsporum audouinii]